MAVKTDRCRTATGKSKNVPRRCRTTMMKSRKRTRRDRDAMIEIKNPPRPRRYRYGLQK